MNYQHAVLCYVPQPIQHTCNITKSFENLTRVRCQLQATVIRLAELEKEETRIETQLKAQGISF